MKSKWMRFTLAVLLIGTMSLLSACGKSEPEQTVSKVVEEAVPAEETFDLQGDYAIDISNLGMALTFYLRIAEDNSFLLSANRAFSDNRGSGTIGELDGTYLMIYSDSTAEKAKTATFERVGPNLIFRSTLPYGSANIMFEKEDEENPEIVYHLVADKYVYEEYYDTYLGFETVDGRDYEYVLTLGPGAKYQYASRPSGAEQPSYEEKGSFRVAKDKLLITPQAADELEGTITAERALEFSVRPEGNSERRTVLFRVATTAQHAGTWYGEQAGTAAVLELDYFAGYTFSATGQGDAQSETGSFEVTGGTISFSKDNQATAVSGSKAGYVLEATFHGLDWVFYAEDILGEFSGGTMVSEAYRANLQMKADGSYTLEIVDAESDFAELVNEVGAFTITASPMAYVVSLSSSDGTVRVGEIWPTGFNMTFDIGGTNYSFLLTK